FESFRLPVPKPSTVRNVPRGRAGAEFERIGRDGRHGEPEVRAHRVAGDADGPRRRRVALPPDLDADPLAEGGPRRRRGWCGARYLETLQGGSSAHGTAGPRSWPVCRCRRPMRTPAAAPAPRSL